MKDNKKIEVYQLILMFIFGFILALCVVYLFRHGTWAAYEFEWSQFLVDVRNVGLVGAGLIGLWLAARRLNVMESQDDKAQRKLDSDDFLEALKMFGDKESQPVRHGGLLALAELAREEPEKYYFRVYSIFRSFVEETPRDIVEDLGGVLRANYELLVVEILQFIGDVRRHKHVRDLEISNNFSTAIRKISVRGENIKEGKQRLRHKVTKGYFEGISFSNAEMYGLSFVNCYINGMKMLPTVRIYNNTVKYKSSLGEKYNGDMEFLPLFDDCYFCNSGKHWDMNYDQNFWSDSELFAYYKGRVREIPKKYYKTMISYNSDLRNKWLSSEFIELPPPKNMIVETIQY